MTTSALQNFVHVFLQYENTAQILVIHWPEKNALCVIALLLAMCVHHTSAGLSVSSCVCIVLKRQAWLCLLGCNQISQFWPVEQKKLRKYIIFLFCLLNSYFPSLTCCLNFSCHWQIFSIRLISMIAAHLLNAVFWNVVLCRQAAGVQAVWNTLAQVTQGSDENSAYFLGTWR